MERLAIDVGGVLIEKKELNGADTNFDVNNVAWVLGAIEAVEILSQKYDLYILSFCGKKTEMETRDALKRIAKYIPEHKWIFTREREHKVAQMHKYGINGLVDDTPVIIKWIKEAGFKGYLFRSKEYEMWQGLVSFLMKKPVEKPLQLNESYQSNIPELTLEQKITDLEKRVGKMNDRIKYLNKRDSGGNELAFAERDFEAMNSKLDRMKYAKNRQDNYDANRENNRQNNRNDNRHSGNTRRNNENGGGNRNTVVISRMKTPDLHSIRDFPSL